jgi:hypothetical protein
MLTEIVDKIVASDSGVKVAESIPGPLAGGDADSAIFFAELGGGSVLVTITDPEGGSFDAIDERTFATTDPDEI